MLNSKDPRFDSSSIPGRAWQLASMLGEVKRLSIELVQKIDGGGLGYTLLTQQAEKIRSVRNFIANPNGVGFGDLKSRDVRQFLALYDPSHYSTAAAVATDLQALDAQLVSINAVYRPLIEAREAGTAVSTDPTTEMIQDTAFTPAELASLRSELVALDGLID